MSKFHGKNQNWRYILQNMNLFKKRKGVSLLLLVFSVFMIVMLLEITVDMGLVLNVRSQLQKSAEIAVLSAVSEFEPYQDSDYSIKYPTDGDITTLFNDIFEGAVLINMNNSFTVTNASLNFSREMRKLHFHVERETDSHFLSLFGIDSLKYSADAAAVNVPRFIKESEIISSGGGSNDTEIRHPSGGGESDPTIEGITSHMDSVPNVNSGFWGIAGPPDGHVLSLGPGGKVTIRLSKPLVTGKGFDLLIHTRGNANGYFIFAGNDVNPNNPYIDSNTPGAGINWVNISCTAVPVNVNLDDGTAESHVYSWSQIIHLAADNLIEPKVYGSNYFELNSHCTDLSGFIPTYDASNPALVRILSAKYLMIIDDNREDGFEMYDTHYKDVLPTRSRNNAKMFPGQHSSLTPGVSIDSISILHNAVLVSNGDNLSSRFTRQYGYDPADYRRMWGCTNYDSAAAYWDNCTSILEAGASTKSLRMGPPPNMNPDEPYHKMLINY